MRIHDEENPASLDENTSEDLQSEANNALTACFHSITQCELPLNTQRALFGLFYAGIATSYYFLEREHRVWESFDEFVNDEILGLMILLYGYEPLMMIFYLLLAKYPQIEESEDLETSSSLEASEQQSSVDLQPAPQPAALTRISREIRIEVSFSSRPSSQIYSLPVTPVLGTASSKNPKLAFVIPCHNSAEIIEDTINACLRHVLPEQIFLIDNGRADAPTDDTRERAHQISPAIHYVYLGQSGNKSVAVYVGTEWVKRHPELEWVFILDDDSKPHKHFTILEDALNNPQVKGVVLPIHALGEDSWIEKSQGFEYKASDLEIAFLDVLDAAPRPHGAGSYWKVDALLDVMKKHNTIFDGEDIRMGLEVLKKRDEHGQWLLKADMRYPIGTIVPSKLLGSGKTLLSQRVKSWKDAQFTYFWELVVGPIFTTNWCRPPLGLIALKNAQLYNLYSQLLHIFRFPIIAAAYDNPTFWMSYGTAMMTQVVFFTIFNYLKLPEEQRSSLLTVLTHPLYKQMDGVMGTMAFVRAVFYSIPNKRRNQTIESRIRDHLIPAIDDILPSESTCEGSASSSRAVYSGDFTSAQAFGDIRAEHSSVTSSSSHFFHRTASERDDDLRSGSSYSCSSS